MKTSRRDFIKNSALGSAGMLTNSEAVEKLMNKFNPAPAVAPNGGSSKSASSVLSLPEGGGAVQGIGEKFQANPFTGTANFSVPVYTSPGRGGFGPELSLQYSSGNGNGIFGLGWDFSFPKVTRKTDKGIPTYQDDKDVFILSGAEDLVPYLDKKGNDWVTQKRKSQLTIDGQPVLFHVQAYRPRVEGLFARIEFWKSAEFKQSAKYSFWKITTKENVTSIYGFNASSKLCHPENEEKVFEWMLELTYDAKGNYIFYTCKEDKGADLLASSDPIPIYEEHRSLGNQVFQLYLKKIQYGNYKPLQTLDFQEVMEGLESNFADRQHFFTTLFDYGEHGAIRYERIGQKEFKVQEITDDIHAEKNGWHIRPDSFSYHRSGFEIRTYRRCERVLMFHHIEGQETLVRSTDFHYEQNAYNGISMLKKVTQRGYRKPEDGGSHFSEEYYLLDKSLGSWVESRIYAIKSFPPLEFDYSSFKPEKQVFKPIEADNGDLPPQALNNPNYTLVDLFGTGLPDVLYTSPFGFFYWKNEGEGRLSRRRKIENIPAGIQLAMPGVGFGDMAGDGQADLLVHEGSTWGYFETDGKAGWQNFRPYKTFPSFSLSDANVRMMDLSGDGKADALRTDINSFVWFPCEGEAGFSKAKYIPRERDLAIFPDVDFSNSRVKLADMTGDGLNDIVLVHEGRVDYWVNMGNGQFSKRITLSNAPRFGVNFDPGRLFLVDIDGSGVADMVYVESGKVRFWFNQSGNRWSEEFVINGTPIVTDYDAIELADILGCGCSSLLWTTNYRGGGRSNYLYLDFTGGIKPNLLVEMNNNMGSITKAQYKPSTHFYRQDLKKDNKRGWVTPLPFPVQVLEKVEKIDHISKTKLVTKYAYHHGFYDGKEREFRGFAFVEQWDTEYFDQFANNNTSENIEIRNLKEGYHLSPSLTKTWYHTGAYLSKYLRERLSNGIGRQSISLDVHDLFKDEYFKGDQDAFDLENTVFERGENGIDTITIREAYRALRGQVLRQEVYGLDGSIIEGNPFTVTESNFQVRLEQPKNDNQHAVYFVHPNESLSYQYERNPGDPRMVQQLTLAVDQYGNINKSLSIAYPRRGDGHYAEQMKVYGTLSFNKFINDDESSDYYNVGVLYESQSFELHGLLEKIGWQQGKKIEKKDIVHILGELNTYEPFHKQEKNGFYKRLLSWNRSYFKSTNNAGCLEITNQNGNIERSFACRLELGNIDKLVLPYESYQAAFHDEQIKDQFPGDETERIEKLEKAGYVKMENHWWIPSGQQAFNAKHFFVAETSADPFGNKNSIEYDSIYLLVEQSENALKNSILAKNDYVTLQPYFIKDINGNGSKVVFDALGMVAGSAVMGKLDDNWNLIRGEGGDIANFFRPYWEYNERYHQQIDDPYLVEDRVRGDDISRAYLSDATTVMLYDLWRNVRLGVNEPPVVYSIAREQHKQLASPIQRKLVYFDGLGREIQTKIEADNSEDGSERWIGSGWKIYNNKSKIIQQFEPFYTNTPDFEDQYEKAIQGESGVSPIIFYDPLDRVVATVHPNGAFEKVVFDSWHQETWDTNDTVNWNPSEESILGEWYQTRPDFKTWKERKLSTGSVAEQIAVAKTERHAETPTIAHIDTLGRSFLTIAEDKEADGKKDYFETKVQLDIQGNDVSITDPMGVECFTHEFGMLQQKIYINSMDAGEKWMLTTVDEQPFWSKDAKGTILENEYDKLRRPRESWVIPFGTQDNRFLATKTYYGEDLKKRDALDKNLLGKAWKVLDQSGIVENLQFDFKGNLLAAQRELWSTFDKDIDVSQPNIPKHAKGIFSETSTFDALNRVIQSTSPDGSVFEPTYNRSNQLKRLTVKVKDSSNQLFVRDIQYNARGQREKIQYGNRITTTYDYEPDTFRLKGLKSVNNQSANASIVLQDLHYTYDPIGNITQIRDDAFQTIFNCGERIEPECNYTYDALYRLIQAEGRQHVSMSGCEYMDQRKHTQLINFRCELFHSTSDEKALTKYIQTYKYDKSGNILEIAHRPTNNRAKRWTRTQTYDTGNSNRILSTATNANCYATSSIEHDENGNITSMPHLTDLSWDYANQIRSVKLNTGDNHYVWYVYGSNGMRSRKVIRHGDKIMTERIYLQGYEIFIDHSGNSEKETLHIMDDQSRITLVETTKNDTLVRYQLSNHLGSASLESNDKGELLTYEEYTPYGSSAFIAAKKSSDSAANEAERKNYRYSGKERDDETGLYYYGARYYAPWMGRWMKADPIGKEDGLNIFYFSGGNPINFKDHLGLKGFPATQELPGGGVMRGEIGVDLTERERFQSLQMSMLHERDSLVSSERNFMIDMYQEKIASSSPDTYIGNVYDDILPASPSRSNYSAAATYTPNDLINNNVRWSLQSSVLLYGIDFGVDEMSKKVMCSTEFSYQLHQSSFNFANDTDTIRHLPWAILTRIDVPNFRLFRALEESDQMVSKLISKPPIKDNEIGGLLIGFTIHTVNSPYGEKSPFSPGQILRTAIDYWSDKIGDIWGYD